MAGLDGNPFADPFKDPAVQRAVSPAGTTTNTTATNDEEYNPFSAGDSNVASSKKSQPSAGATATTVTMDEAELFRQQEELRKREQELMRRQAEFERRQQQSNANGGIGGRQRPPHNWPPLPSYIPMEPCFYQDIDVEIPPQFQETVRWVYHVYLIYVLALALNLVASLIYVLFAGGPFGLAFLAVIQLGLFTPCAFLLWFRPLYKGFRDDSSFNFMVFFLILFISTIFTGIQAVGLSQYASGWTEALSVIQNHVLVGLVMILSAVGLTIAFIGMVLSLIKVHRFYRGAGFSLDKARQEFSSGVMADRHVQQAANQAARAAATHAVNEMTGGRY